MRKLEKSENQNTVMDLLPFPYKTTLCFAPLVEYIKEKQSAKNKAVASLAREVIQKIKAVPELLEWIDDMQIIEEHRLWQLSVTCKISQLMQKLKSSLPLPLETAPLILIHNSPIAIRFREDEKQFDVDGAYNIRYEIVKKRIDKAKIKGTGERLTQPGQFPQN